MNYDTKQGLGKNHLAQFSVHHALFILRNKEPLSLCVPLRPFAKAMLWVLQQFWASIKAN